MCLVVQTAVASVQDISGGETANKLTSKAVMWEKI